MLIYGSFAKPHFDWQGSLIVQSQDSHVTWPFSIADASKTKSNSGGQKETNKQTYVENAELLTDFIDDKSADKWT